MRRILFSLSIAIFLSVAGANATFAQRVTPRGISIEKDLLLLRRDLNADKKKLVALNVPLTEQEAAKFWPVYDEYAEEMRKVTDEFYTLVRDYAARQKVITDTEALATIKKWGELQVLQVQIRQKYIPLFSKVIPGRKLAHCLQLDRRLYAMMDIQTSAELPLTIQ